MSVIVKGMKMPERCIDCLFMISRENDDCIVQSATANELAVTWEDLKRDCPLVEIPEHHGRLIDVDNLEPDTDYDDGEYWAYSIRQVYDVSTIFEPEYAEEDDEY